MNIHQLIVSYNDIRSYIFNFLPDYTINNFLSCDRALYKVKKLISFVEPIMLNDKICKLSYYDSFTNIFNHGLYMNTLPSYPKDYYDINYMKIVATNDGFTIAGMIDSKIYDGEISSDNFNYNPSRFYRHLKSEATKERNLMLEEYTDQKKL